MHQLAKLRFPMALLIPLISSTALSVGAEEIHFDERAPTNANCCYLTTEYDDLGVTFSTTDDGSIWGGLSNGNPGAWFLDGTNGPAFLGFNGASFGARIFFDAPVSAFSLDMAPSIGWDTPDDLFIVEGYFGGVLVDRVSLPPIGFAQWTTVPLQGEIDEVVFVSSGPSFPNTFGIDNLQWLPGVGDPGLPTDAGDPSDPALLSVDLDIEPRHDRNFVNLFKRGLTRVAILGSETLDVESLDATSLLMGPGEAQTKRVRVKDINRDGFPDLVARFKTRKLGLALGDTEACLSGMTREGLPFEGCDAIDTLRVKSADDRDDDDSEDESADADDCDGKTKVKRKSQSRHRGR